MKKAVSSLAAIFILALPFAALAAGRVLFSPVKLAETDDERLSVSVSNRLSLTTWDTGSYRTLAGAGDTDAEGNTFGLLLDINGGALKSNGAPRVSNRPDGNSALNRDGRLFLLTQFEDSPGAAYVTEFERKNDGSLKALRFNPVDFSVVNGAFINCSASMTPWGTTLASEEDYFLDAFSFDPRAEEMTARHINHCEKDQSGRLTGGYSPPPFSPGADLSEWCGFVKGMRDDYLKDPVRFSPYNYGYSIELSPDSSGRASVVNGTKHYAFGKYSPEMALVMPDERTVYITDDGSYAGFFMFVADKQRDLSSGTLYMAKWTAEGERASSSGSISWVRLGHGSDEAIKAVIGKKPSFSDIFEIAPAGPCGNGFKMVKAGGAALSQTRDGKRRCIRKFKDMRGASCSHSRRADTRIPRRNRRVHEPGARLQPGRERLRAVSSSGLDGRQPDGCLKRHEDGCQQVRGDLRRGLVRRQRRLRLPDKEPVRALAARPTPRRQVLKSGEYADENATTRISQTRTTSATRTECSLSERDSSGHEQRGLGL